MADPIKVLEGVMAINKPKGISSAQALRDLQKHFNPSKLFAPWLAAEREKRDTESHNQRNRRSSAKRRLQVKIGHGGTLDPLATGVLITGIGSGTKHLQGFLECTKSYEAVVLFGAATDTYDTEGAVVKKASYAHITEQSVRKALDQFRGKIMQRPPIFSALRIEGKRLYEYAREGKEIPKAIEKRPVGVEELEMVAWMEGGSHGYKWPDREAEPQKKQVADALLDSGSKGADRDIGRIADASPTRKRKHEDDAVDDDAQDSSKAAKTEQTPPVPLMSGALQPEGSQNTTQEQPGQRASPEPKAGEEGGPPGTSDRPSPPAARLRMTVTSGFYVRSLCHDLGETVGSLAIMSDLVRTRQGEFELGKNVLEYEDLAQGEDVWGPNVQQMLEDWNAKHGASKDKIVSEAKQSPSGGEDRKSRRNTSSPEKEGVQS